MKKITASVTEQNLIIAPSVLSVSESVNLYWLSITYDSEWDDVDAKIVTFKGATGVAVAVQDYGNEDGVAIPWEVLQAPGKVSVGVIGYVGTTQKITTTGLYDRNTFVVLPEACGLKSAMTPTPDVYQQLLQTIDQFRDSIAELDRDIGDLEALETHVHTNLVAAINEVLSLTGDSAVKSVNGKTGEVVLKTSDIENDSNYVTEPEVITDINDALDAFDEDVDRKINNEATARQSADEALSTRVSANSTAIANEATARQDADNSLQSQIDAISASSDVTDIVGTYAELQAYDTSTLGNNDIVKVLQDESQNGETTYYRWSTTTQSFTLIGEEGPYYTKGEADGRFVNQTAYSTDKAALEAEVAGKQNALTAGDNVQLLGDVISATDTTYTSGTGLNLAGTTFSADTTFLATVTYVDAQVGNIETILQALNSGTGANS